MPHGGRVRAPTLPRDAVATIAAWSLDVEEPRRRSLDPWLDLVRHAIDEYRAGHGARIVDGWSEDAVWQVAGRGGVSGEYRGPEAIFGYHLRLTRLSGGTFRQRLLYLESSNGPVVAAYLRTEARRGDRRIEMPTLAVFEVHDGRIGRVTEMPGDQEAWDRFWAD